MKKDAIKVVKRGAQRAPVVVPASKIERNNQLKMVHMVDKWISERRENSQAEKVFSDSKILGWKITSENI